MANDDVQRVDARSLRGLAHPLRVRLMELLWLDGPDTATGLAARVGESTGTTSYHLRQLAEHGFIEDDPSRGTKRERWWRYRPAGMTLAAADFIDDPDLRGPLSVYLHESLNQLYQRIARFLAEDWGREWYEVAAASDWNLRLRPAELAALNDEVTAVVARYRETHDAERAEPREGDEHVVVQLQSFPYRRPASR
jgi:DNA-binding transcriptional ArsR family regulator